MSQEFEKIVLEKLDNFEGRFDKIEKTLDEHTEKFKEIDKKLDEHSEKIDRNTKEIEGLTEVVMSHTDAIQKLDKKVDNLIDTVEVNKNILIKLEYDVNLKFNTLMDFFAKNEEEHKRIDDTLLHYNSKLLSHDIKISALENEIKKDSMLA